MRRIWRFSFCIRVMRKINGVFFLILYFLVIVSRIGIFVFMSRINFSVIGLSIVIRYFFLWLLLVRRILFIRSSWLVRKISFWEFLFRRLIGNTRLLWLTKSIMLSRSLFSVVFIILTGLFRAISIKFSVFRGLINWSFIFITSSGFIWSLMVVRLLLRNILFCSI